MKEYNVVVEERYNTREKELSIYDNIYSEINTLGFYITMKLKSTICEVFRNLKDVGIDFTMCRILDVGCGNGSLLRYIADLKGNSENLYGMDLSAYRIEKAKKINPGIKYMVDDIVETKIKNENFNIITALDLFMHLSTEQQILKALSNVFDMLSENGVFIWYDVYSESHFKTSEDAEYSGFNFDEMKRLADKAGFEILFQKTQFKYLFNDLKNSTAYLGNQYPFWMLELMEEKLPGAPVNIIMVFKKKLFHKDLNLRESEIEFIINVSNTLIEAIEYMYSNINNSDVIGILINDILDALSVVNDKVKLLFNNEYILK